MQKALASWNGSYCVTGIMLRVSPGFCLNQLLLACCNMSSVWICLSNNATIHVHIHRDFSHRAPVPHTREGF